MKYAWMLAATVLVAPSIAFSQNAPAPQPQGTQSSAQQPVSTADFVTRTGIGNLFEIQSSTFAREKSRNEQIRQFAERMISDHTLVNDKLKSAARNPQVPSALDAQHEQMLQQLRDTPEANFDRAYIDIQADGHHKTVAMFEQYAQSGDDPQLKQFAEQALPGLRDHLQKVSQLEQQSRTGGARNDQGANQGGEQPEQPKVVVQQPAPSIRMEQAPPQIIVRQPQPEIIVRQPQPTITVNIPQPEITVHMSKPDVHVAMAQAQREQPQVQVQQGAGQPQIRFERVEPRVVVNQQQGQPQVRIEQRDEAQAHGRGNGAQQPQPTQPSQPEQKPIHTQPQPQQQAQPQPQQQALGQNISASHLMDMYVYGTAGGRVGDVERVVMGPNGKIFVVTGVGGFLGIGERRVAIPLDRLTVQGDRLVLRDITEEQVRGLPVFNRNEPGYHDVTGSQEVKVGSLR